jgi:hypothetical protein
MTAKTLPGRALTEVSLVGVSPLAHDADRGVLLSRKARVIDGEDGLRLERLELGALTLPSGQVIACDPTYEDFAGRPPFQRAVRPGRYPVALTQARVGDEPYVRIAAAALLLRDEPPTRWTLALTGEQRLADLGPGEIYGYGVDGGTGCFVDAEHAAEFGPRLFARLRKAYERANFEPLIFPLRDEPAVAVFQSGFGDGFYASYWGLDARGEAVCLVTDFGVLTRPITVTLRFGEDGGVRPGALEHPALAHVGVAGRVTRTDAREVAVELTGATAALQGLRLLERRGDAWAAAPASCEVEHDERRVRQTLRPEPALAGAAALELELMVGAALMRAEEAPQPKSPVLRRRKP